jgi:nitric oxide reductase subunit C
MNLRQARLFAIASSALSALLFGALTLHSHTRFDELTRAQDLTPAVIAGKDVWHKYNCVNCHTLFGEGAYYAPDLTKIATHRSEAYLKAYMRDPSKFYDERRHRRLMPTQNLSDAEIADLVTFLDWVSKVDNQGWPPRPILVSGGSLQVAALGAERGARPPAPRAPPRAAAASGAASPVGPDDDPRAKGDYLFRTTTPVCTACHSLQPDVQLAGPSLAGIASRAAQAVADPAYRGQATDAAGYIRESILAPSAHLVPGQMFSAGGVSFMPTTYGESLDEPQVEQLVAYLSSLK